MDAVDEPLRAARSEQLRLRRPFGLDYRLVAEAANPNSDLALIK
ncbi:hypothetical protein SS05631_c34000 [Sinorhizobium sp. CCBAU 05631]|nr:hypothetical protein SS05631_c34000 [Sinorhizobium sp. CCBAU 05631]